MSNMQDPLERAYYALIDVENAKRKVDRAYGQALEGEEYQYGVTYIGGKHDGRHIKWMEHGERHIEWVEPTGDAELDKETLHLLASRWERKGQFPKIVRRRVSPPEVISE